MDIVTALVAFALGVLLAPVVRPLMRPLFVELIRVVLLTADEVQRLSSQVREDIQDASAEAQAAREAKAKREQTTPADPGAPAPPA
jgi:hypothetical protein